MTHPPKPSLTERSLTTRRTLYFPGKRSAALAARHAAMLFSPQPTRTSSVSGATDTPLLFTANADRTHPKAAHFAIQGSRKRFHADPKKAAK
jgi:hypothetical protein